MFDLNHMGQSPAAGSTAADGTPSSERKPANTRSWTPATSTEPTSNRKPAESVALANGDEIQMGKFRLVFLTRPTTH